MIRMSTKHIENKIKHLNDLLQTDKVYYQYSKLPWKKSNHVLIQTSSTDHGQVNLIMIAGNTKKELYAYISVFMFGVETERKARLKHIENN